MMGLTCRCVWGGKRCSHHATQEDGLCDWCGTRRLEDLLGNPNASIDPLTGEVTGLGGRGYDHIAGVGGIDPDLRPDACWMPGSGRVLATEGT